MKKRRVIVLISLALIIFAVGVGLLAGIYIEPPIQGKSPGRTVLFYRRLLMTPLLFSADSIALDYGAVPTDAIREAVSRTIHERIDRYVLLRLPFNRRLYLMTTGNKDFLRVDREKRLDGARDD